MNGGWSRRFRRIPLDDDWFEVYQIAEGLFAFHEPRHFEETTASLIVGEERGALIDTGCGIGDLRRAVEAVTRKPVVVINTHTHPDHLGGNRQWSAIAMFDHPLARRVAESGLSEGLMRAELLADRLVTGPWPASFDARHAALPPFAVQRWLRDGDRIDLGGCDLEVIHTPGEAPDHICLLDRAGRTLFCGDILLHGPVWTHLEGGSVSDLVGSYRRLMGRFAEFDHLMPGHNEPWLEKDLLPESLAGAQRVAAGEAESREIVDPWHRKLKRYDFGRFQILTRT